MTTEDRTTLEASRRSDPPHPRVGAIDTDEVATVTLYLRPGPTAAQRAPSTADPADPESPRLTREEYKARHGAADEDLAVVESFARAEGLEVGETDAARRSVQLTARLANLAAAFGTENLAVHAAADGTRYRARTGPLSLPADVAAVVEGVFGLDQRPQAATQWRAGPPGGSSYTPVQVAEAYGYPSSVDGSGQCVAIVELGGGYRAADLDAYFPTLGLGVPSVTAVSVDGGTNSPTTADGADSEVMLDIEVVGSVAPGARIAVYFAPNTDQGFLDAVTTAVHDTTNTPSVVSISWGGAESTWTAQAMQQMEAAFTAAAAVGVTIIVAAGDNGSTDGQTDGLQHVDFPASAPHALACGGTSVQLAEAGSTETVTSEVVWDDLANGGGATGGGVSAVFPLPSYQTDAGVPVSANAGAAAGRGVPDVAGDADPSSGYAIRVDGGDEVVGGTSAVAPLWAGLIACLNQGLGRDVGFVHPQLYALEATRPASGPVFRDIVSGSNGAYQAGTGWDPCTGLGSPHGAALLAALQQAPPTAPPATPGAPTAPPGPPSDPGDPTDPPAGEKGGLSHKHHHHHHDEGSP